MRNQRVNEAYYVSVIDAGRFRLLAGPFPTHEEAEKHVEPARKIAYERDPWAWFYAYGTCMVQDGHKTGLLNEELGLCNSTTKST